jgi:hypothetical protein
MNDGMDNEEDRDFMRQCEDLAQGTQNSLDRERWQRAAASFRRMAEHEPKQEDRNSGNKDD